ncbi:MAG: DUF695 domain-containing protein [Gemmataceae bacterium]
MPWFTAMGEEAGKPLVFRCRRILPDGAEQQDCPHRVSIYWPYTQSNENGMPDEETNQNQVRFEAALDDLLTHVDAYLMLVVTGNSRKEWHWYTRDVEVWVNEANKRLVDMPPFPITIENTEEPDWSLYNNFLAGVRGLES